MGKICRGKSNKSNWTKCKGGCFLCKNNYYYHYLQFSRNFKTLKKYIKRILLSFICDFIFVIFSQYLFFSVLIDCFWLNSFDKSERLLSFNDLIKLYVLIISRTLFKVNARSIVAWMSRKYLLEAAVLSDV